MDEIVRKYLETISIGDLQLFKNIGIFPLLLELEVPFEYYTLNEALKEEAVTITEVTEGGEIPNLRLVNRSPKMILILEGEELVGAKQNRIANISMLIGGYREVIIPVSCVERGRWSYRSYSFASDWKMFSPRMRRSAQEDIQSSIAHDRGFRTDQRRVWDAVYMAAERLGIYSPTEAMSDIYEQEKTSIDEYLKSFRVVPNQVGMIVLIDHQVVGMDSFGKSDTLKKVFEKLVSSYCLEALDAPESAPCLSEMKDLALEFLNRATAGKVYWKPSVDLGVDGRIEGEKITGSSLAFEEKLLHLAIFSKGELRKTGSRYIRPFQSY